MKKYELIEIIELTDDTKYHYSMFDCWESTFCPECGELIRWETCRLEDSEDDKFSGVLKKLIYHQENDKSCIREQKLKGLLK